jgi:hypothetical protein
MNWSRSSDANDDRIDERIGVVGDEKNRAGIRDAFALAEFNFGVIEADEAANSAANETEIAR